MSNILIVENHNDKFFIEALINHINSNLKVEEPICNINEFECLGGINKLEEKLNSLEHKILKGEIEKIGIIFDADNVGIEDRKQQIEEKM